MRYVNAVKYDTMIVLVGLYIDYEVCELATIFMIRFLDISLYIDYEVCEFDNTAFEQVGMT